MARKPSPSEPSAKGESLTVRRLDPGTKQGLRLRAAASGRSVEDEVRDILRRAASPAPAAGTSPMAAGPATAPAAPSPEGAVAGPRITLIVGGGIAAYKSLDLIRRLRERGCHVRCVLTAAAQHFVTALSAGALAGERAYTDLFDPAREFDVGHIRLAREADLVVVAPATADLMAKMAHGQANDLATAVLLATRAPILLAPAMNPAMWEHPATQRNLARVTVDGAHVLGPNRGEMAEAGEAGIGRMAEPLDIAMAALDLLRPARHLLKGRRVLVTAGPTHEPIDPVRYIANRSSGRQGFAIARAAARAGAHVTLISGPVALGAPEGVDVVHVESARDMLRAVERALPVDVAIFAAAVADWRAAQEGAQKIKKSAGAQSRLDLVENPDILAKVAQASHDRPSLVIGFAAETQNLIANAKAKLARKGCDWIVANDVSAQGGVMGGDTNSVHIIRARRDGTGDATSDIEACDIEAWPRLAKEEVAARLVAAIGAHLAGSTTDHASP